jgi:hypothetical protein
MRKSLLCFVVATMGCGGNDGLGHGDMALPPLPDLAMHSVFPDMSMPTMFGGSQQAQFSSSSMTMPTSTSKYAYDLDGDGSNDNRLGSIMSALAALGMDPQGSADAAVQSGALLLLFDESSNDPTQQTDPAASVALAMGKKPALAPKYDGTDSFTVDTSSMPAHFEGAITGGTFDSKAVATATTPVTATLVLPLVPAQPPLVLPVTGAHLKFTRNAAGIVTGGQINGGVKKSDVDSIVLPAIAAMLTAQLPTGGATIAMFDTNMDGTITTGELMGNALISNFLSPDVQLFQGGVWGPNPAKTTKDCLSMGLGFTGATATF